MPFYPPSSIARSKASCNTERIVPVASAGSSRGRGVQFFQLAGTTRFSRPSESQLAFDFDATKLAQALAFLATSVRDLSKLKAAKLLYFADKQHLLQHGRPIIGDRYFCLDCGPVPAVS